MTVLGDPDRHRLPLEPRLELLVEARQRRERHVRPLHERVGREFGLNGYGWCDQALNLSLGFALRDELGELARRVRVGDARDAPVAAPRRGLADRHVRQRVPGLEAGVRRGVEPGVVRGRDRPARRVELGREEEVQVGLVPDRPEADERVAREPARVAGRDRARERGEVGEVPWHHVRVPPAVRPTGSAGDREHDLLIGLLRLARRLVDVVEGVGGIERIRRVRRVSAAP